MTINKRFAFFSISSSQFAGEDLPQGNPQLLDVKTLVTQPIR
jgi:hypothetical protein